MLHGFSFISPFSLRCGILLRVYVVPRPPLAFRKADWADVPGQIINPSAAMFLQKLDGPNMRTVFDLVFGYRFFAGQLADVITRHDGEDLDVRVLCAMEQLRSTWAVHTLLRLVQQGRAADVTPASAAHHDHCVNPATYQHIWDTYWADGIRDYGMWTSANSVWADLSILPMAQQTLPSLPTERMSRAGRMLDEFCPMTGWKLKHGIPDDGFERGRGQRAEIEAVPDERWEIVDGPGT
ncbi:hypothetical protein B0H67DRAFT_682927 [Lasiosphaeris hirsuta]|uniref:Uncharacterized protein n=1 Tax=Lasiosphaeris hirsuta TaxID=260670 RepID=A0AA40AEN2_9PEZI|nr:hypothetical protein B0H67DRAFT_682927 [Lasiosphaeris hirsuta]